ncbi:MAG: DUF3307 domain-containing protein [Chloroflexi bacterium]|nr:MAG: DUF3307 domain-containing protein [Chloroflexota bacterium]
MTLFERGLIAHLIADWLLQSDWMAANKNSLLHPAAWVHAGIYGLVMWIAVGWQGGVVLGVLHLLIDTRVPLNWWQRVCRQGQNSTTAVHVAIWTDQAIHIILLGLWLAWTVN